MNIFVGDLSFDADETNVKEAFEKFGRVGSVIIIKEKNGVTSRGFGFVEMPDQQEALAAIEALHGKEFMGRALNLGEARSKTAKGRVRGFKSGSGYKLGRRTRSFMKRKMKTGGEGN
ncbi:MAG: RNA-binding protein [Candidatus Omnitrophota bacterium]|nr:RNA-binding protein [Candidatus Omnitrophota bacterium]